MAAHHSFVSSSLRWCWCLLVSFLCVSILFVDPATAGRKVRDNAADPSAIKVGDFYYSAEAADGAIYVRGASTLEGLGAPNVWRERVWSPSPGLTDIWAPDMTTDLGRTFIHFSAGKDAAHRMYVISADSPLNSVYSGETKLALPDDQWAIDGTFFVFNGLGYMVWSGWDSNRPNAEQNLYICRMDSPSKPIGKRYIISQPREPWETEKINEGPQAIVDPAGQLHIVYSASGSWTDNYCLADLRLKKGGDPFNVWDWYKSNGCLFGSHKERMMPGWDPTQKVNGPGHHTFALPDGEVRKSPGGTNQIPFMFHAVEKGKEYSWGNRAWFTGSFVWWGGVTYKRANVPGPNEDTGASFKFFE
ncbi:putative alpha-N-arabinofuranosidase 2 [Apodospora peruviana]|uniref:Alpha-N-arabinofuranosidase 2 n=1 Tax=Apodospora peruviana TaxID=516989 RepID=A0AAE0HXT2_9PEZI|nr:putative alpha-N-arabinofuranosidase 2 [Apodospora peruviana]